MCGLALMTPQAGIILSHARQSRDGLRCIVRLILTGSKVRGLKMGISACGGLIWIIDTWKAKLMTDNQITNKHDIKLSVASTTADICKILDQCQSEAEIEECVSNIRHQGRHLYSRSFNIRFDDTSRANDIRDRIWITLG